MLNLLNYKRHHIINVQLFFILSELYFKQILSLFALLFLLNKQLIEFKCVYINFLMTTASDVRALKGVSLARAVGVDGGVYQ